MTCQRTALLYAQLIAVLMESFILSAPERQPNTHKAKATTKSARILSILRP